MDKFTRNALSLTLLAVAVIFGYTTKVVIERVIAYTDIYVRSAALNVTISVLPFLVGALFAYLIYRINRVRTYLLDVISEIKKVVWPNKKETWSATGVVIVAVIISGLVLALFDWLSGLFLGLFLS